MRKLRNKTEKLRKSKYVFDIKALNSSDGMLVSIWGPPAWLFLHTLSFNYPVKPTEEDKINYMEFIKSLQYILPCYYCRINLKKNMEKFPITLEKMRNRETFSRYVYELHEHVNIMLGKKSGLSYEDVRERYEWFRARCRPDEIANRTKMINKIKAGNKTKKHKGCNEPLYGKKGKCIMRIVPQELKAKTFEINKKCKMA